MISAVLVLLVASMSPAEPKSAPAGSIERIVVVLGENDVVTSSRVLGQLKSCTDARPTAVVSVHRGLRIEKDFAGSRSLAAVLPAEKVAKARTLPAALELLAEALAPVGPTTAVVLVSPQVVAGAGMGVTSPQQPAVDGAETSNVEFYGTAEIPSAVLAARKSLRQAGLTVVAVNTNGVSDAGAKALTEIPKGRYLRYSQNDFPKAFASAVCGPER